MARSISTRPYRLQRLDIYKTPLGTRTLQELNRFAMIDLSGESDLSAETAGRGVRPWM